VETFQTDINLFRWAIYFVFGIPFVAWIFLTRNNALRVLAVLSVLICVQETFVARRYIWAIGIGPSNITAYVALMACLMRNGLQADYRGVFAAWGAFILSAFLGLLIGSIGSPYLVQNYLKFQEFYVEGFLWFLLGLAAFRRADELHQFLVGLVALGIVMAAAHLFCIATGYNFPNYPLSLRISQGQLTNLGNGALFTNVNSMANAAAPLIALALMFALARRETRLVRLMAVGCLLMLLASLLLTNSRGGYLVTSLLLLLALYWSGRGLGRTALAVVASLTIVGIGVAGTALFLPDLFDETIEILQGQGLATPRPLIWLGYLHLIPAHPFGVGLDELNVRPLIPVYQLYSELAHNIYLDLAARVGLPGLFAFLVLVGIVVARNLRAMRLARDPAQRWFLACLFFLVSSFLVGGFFEPIYQNSLKLVHMFWLYSGISLCMSTRIVTESRLSARSPALFGSEPEPAEALFARTADEV
jgi:O-antigen ligase